jgi:uncharacterized DUF497 family protein
VKTDYDIAKSARNIRERELPFEHVSKLIWEAADIRIDSRRDYGEIRYSAYMPDESGRLFHVVFTVDGEALRIISLRKANKREEKRYDPR